jgi:acetyl-CoA carboxylase biotin carboxyl carrier protein
MRTKTAQEILELMDAIKQSGVQELRLEMPGFKFHAIKNSLSEPPLPADGSLEGARSRNDLRPIVAPRLGFFRRAEKPGTPFLAGPGQKVQEKDVVGFIQVLEKIYSVPSGVRGIIERISVEDGEMVEFNQPLFLVADSQEKA